MEKKTLFYRLLTLGIVVLGFVGIAAYKLYDLQIVNGLENQQKAEQRLSGNTPIYAARGEIVDRNGEKLISNSMSYIISFSRSNWNYDTQNDTILKLVDLFKKYQLPYNTSFPISYKDGEYLFTADGTQLFKFLESKSSDTGYETAIEIVLFLKERYVISDSYTQQEIIDIISIRYQMELDAFSTVNDFIFAEITSEEIVAIIKEQKQYYEGVHIDVKPTREYKTPYAAHILGRVGPIFAEEYQELRSQGYKMNAVIGKDGMEKYLEPYIRAIDGKKATNLTVDGEIIASGKEIAPIPGNNAVLTLDLKLQQVAEQSLARTIDDIKAKAQRNNLAGKDAAGGAVVVLDVNTSEVLALASYPTYSLEDFNENYNQMLADPLKPMFNRAISGTYAPGSTYKMVTAIAALEQGIVTPNTKIEDKGRYMFYAPTYTPGCWIFNQRGLTHGHVDVTGALKVSCNYYFYEVGRLLGGEKQEQYAKMFGLGERTGIELAGEAKGIVAGPTARKQREQTWYPGDSLASAIGQSDHLFTPIQLANYVAAIANGGTLNKVHLLKSIETYDYSETVEETEVEVLSNIAISQETLDAVFAGMNNVVNEGGTAGYVFRNYPIQVAGKTGTAEVDGGSANGVFVSFAPYENPEIAVCVLGERIGSSGDLATVVRDIYDAYFQLNQPKVQAEVPKDMQNVTIAE